ncbi:MAG: DUF167 family protein [Methyloceanibacter sp.]
MNGRELRLDLRKSAADLTLPVRLTPKAARDEIAGVEEFGGDAVLKARVCALPESRRANDAVERLIAGWLGLPKTSVKVAQGGKSRLKKVSIAGDADTLAETVAVKLVAIRGNT